MEQSSIKGRSLINEKLAKLNSFKELIFFFLKYSFSCTKIMGSLILITIIFMGTIAELPYYFAFTATQSLGIFIISAMIYGSTFYTFRKSTIFENMRETNLKKKEIYLAIFIVMSLFAFMIYFFLISLFLICIATNSSLIMADWFFSTAGFGTGGLLINQINYQLLFWWFIACVFLNFSLFYLFQNIANSQKTFFLFTFFYLLLLLIYGNVFFPPRVAMDYYDWLSIHPEIDGILRNNLGLSYGEIRILFCHFNIAGEPHVRQTLKDDFKDEHYIDFFMSILVPHFWINIFCPTIWKGTALQTDEVMFSLSIPKFPEVKLEKTILVSYSLDSLKHAKIWSFKTEIWWLLAMYSWFFYFILLYFIGTITSRLKKN